MGGAGREGVESPCPLTSIRPWEKWPIFEGSFNQLAARTRAKIRRRKETSRSEREIIQSEEKKEKKEEILLPSPWHGGAQVWKATSKATAANWIYNELVSPWTKFRVAACLPACRAPAPPRVSFATGCVGRIGRRAGKRSFLIFRITDAWYK